MALGGLKDLPSLKLTASLHLKMDAWNISFLLGYPLFRGNVRFREGSQHTCRASEEKMLKHLPANKFAHILAPWDASRNHNFRWIFMTINCRDVLED